MSLRSIIANLVGILTADVSNGNPLPPSGVFADSGAINLNADDGQTLFTSATALTLGGAVIRHPAGTTTTLVSSSVNQEIISVSGSLTIDNNQGATDPNNGPVVFVNTDATVLLDGSQFLQTLNILPQGTARMLENGSAILDVDNLQIGNAADMGATGDNGGVLDLADNDLIAHSADNTALENALTNGYDGGKWDGQTTPGAAAIISSVAEQDTTGTEAIGYALEGSDSYSGQISLSSFDGQSVEYDDFLARLTHYGDANLDGKVDLSDQSIMQAAETYGYVGWGSGDFNFSGAVDQYDFHLFNEVFVATPTDFSAMVASPTEVDLSWMDSATDADNDVIYESTDGGLTFQPVAEIGSLPSGALNTYAITGLNAGCTYQFYITTLGSYEESDRSNIEDASVSFEPPTLDVEGATTIFEGEPYEVDLAALYPNGEPGSIDHWRINWDDGAGFLNYYYPSEDRAEPLVVYHSFTNGAASASLVIQAVDLANGTWSSNQTVAITPVLNTLAATIDPPGQPGELTVELSSDYPLDGQDQINQWMVTAGDQSVYAVDGVATFENISTETQVPVAVTAYDVMGHEYQLPDMSANVMPFSPTFYFGDPNSPYSGNSTWYGLGGLSATLDWYPQDTAPGLTYEVQRSYEGSPWQEVGQTSDCTYTDKGLTPDEEHDGEGYVYRVAAIAAQSTGQGDLTSYSDPIAPDENDRNDVNFETNPPNNGRTSYNPAPTLGSDHSEYEGNQSFAATAYAHNSTMTVVSMQIIVFCISPPQATFTVFGQSVSATVVPNTSVPGGTTYYINASIRAHWDQDPIYTSTTPPQDTASYAIVSQVSVSGIPNTSLWYPEVGATSSQLNTFQTNISPQWAFVGGIGSLPITVLGTGLGATAYSLDGFQLEVTAYDPSVIQPLETTMTTVGDTSSGSGGFDEVRGSADFQYKAVGLGETWLQWTDIFGDQGDALILVLPSPTGNLTVHKEVIGWNPTQKPGGENQASTAALSKTEQTKVGAFIPWDTLDEDYDGKPDYQETTASSGRQAVPDDTLMLKITLAGLTAQNQGFYSFNHLTDFKVFNDATGAVVTPAMFSTNFSSDPAANSDGSRDFWIEAIGGDNADTLKRGNVSEVLQLFWQQAAGDTPQPDDSVKLTSFTWTGSQDVPDNSTYPYNVDTDGLPKTSQWTKANSKNTSNVAYARDPATHALITSDALITWSEGPAFGEAVYEVSANYSWEFTVNIVRVDIDTSVNAKNTMQTDPNQPKPALVKPLTPTNSDPGVKIDSVNPNPKPNDPAIPAMNASSTFLSITGMNYHGVMRGVKWMEIGYIQLVKMDQENGTYRAYTILPNTGQIVLSGKAIHDRSTARQDNNFHTDGNVDGTFPWQDTVTLSVPGNPASIPRAFVSGNFLNDDPTKPATTVALYTQDSPNIYGAPSAKMNGSNLAIRVDIVAAYNLSAAVATSKLDDPMAVSMVGSSTDRIFTARESGTWTFNGSGKLTFKATKNGAQPYDFDYSQTVFTPDAQKGIDITSNFKTDKSTIQVPDVPYANNLLWIFEGNPKEPPH